MKQDFYRKAEDTLVERTRKKCKKEIVHECELDGFKEDSIDIDQEVDVMEFAYADTYTDTDKKNVVRLFAGEVPQEGIRILSDLIVSKPSTGMQQNMILEDNMTILIKVRKIKCLPILTGRGH